MIELLEAGDQYREYIFLEHLRFCMNFSYCRPFVQHYFTNHSKFYWNVANFYR